MTMTGDDDGRAASRQRRRGLVPVWLACAAAVLAAAGGAYAGAAAAPLDPVAAQHKRISDYIAANPGIASNVAVLEDGGRGRAIGLAYLSAKHELCFAWLHSEGWFAGGSTAECSTSSGATSLIGPPFLEPIRTGAPDSHGLRAVTEYSISGSIRSPAVTVAFVVGGRTIPAIITVALDDPADPGYSVYRIVVPPAANGRLGPATMVAYDASHQVVDTDSFSF